MTALGDALTPLLRLLPPERAHRLSIAALRCGLAPRQAEADEPVLAQTLFGLTFANPVGIAAGFDKDAEAMAPLLTLGFGFVEVGSITPRPQQGNPRPRLFRLPEDEAVINRLGFNSRGAETAAARLRRFRESVPRPRGPVGINIGKNKDSSDAAADYAAAAATLAAYADYLVVNVSSPNTPGLRALQEPGELEAILAAVRAAAPDPVPPVLVKIAPDFTEADIEAIATLARDGGLDGLVVSNTTVSRPAGLTGRHRGEAGGLSGRPLAPIALSLLREMYRRTRGAVPLIGVGGIASGADAYARIRAGASLVQLYTALIYRGPGLVRGIKEELATRLQADGFAHVGEAVGVDAEFP